MTLAAVRPSNDKWDIIGNVSYNDGYGAWNVIRLKKEVLREFPQLREKSARIRYKLVFYKNYREFSQELKQMEKNNEPLPILLYFYKTE